MNILVESCTEYMYENLNNILESSDNNKPQSRKNIFEKIVTFFKKLWLWIKELFMKILGKTKDKIYRLIDRLKIENEVSEKEMVDLYNFYNESQGKDLISIISLDLLGKKMQPENIDEAADELHERKSYYEDKLKDLSERIKSNGTILKNIKDEDHCTEIIRLCEFTMKATKLRFDVLIANLSKYQKIKLHDLTDEQYSKIAYLGQIGARYDVEMNTIIINLVNEIINNTYKHYGL